MLKKMHTKFDIPHVVMVNQDEGYLIKYQSLHITNMISLYKSNCI